MTIEQILDLSAADMNDSQQVNYTDAAMLPYFNMAAKELLERMEESNIPVTNKSASIVLIPAGVSAISLITTPALPVDFIEPLAVFESPDGINFTPMARVEFIDPNLQYNINLSSFGNYAWMGNRLEVPPATGDLYLKFQYTARVLVLPIAIELVVLPFPVPDAELFIAHKTAALCATFVAQDEMRAGALNELAEQAIQREMNIPTKGKQSIVTRRRPFRSSYKSLNRVW